MAAAVTCAICRDADGTVTTTPLNGLPLGVVACDECRAAVQRREVGVTVRPDGTLSIVDARISGDSMTQELKTLEQVANDLAPRIVHKTTTRSLPVRLNEDELLKAGNDLATVVQDIGGEESRQADIKASMKAKLAELEGRRTQLAIVVSRKEEYRDVRVETWHDFQRGIVQDVRTDTGEILSIRAMSDDERQPKLL